MADWSTVAVAFASGGAAVGAAYVGALTQARAQRYEADADLRLAAVERRTQAYEDLLAVSEEIHETLSVLATIENVPEGWEEAERAALIATGAKLFELHSRLSRAVARVGLLGIEIVRQEAIELVRIQHEAVVAFQKDERPRVAPILELAARFSKALGSTAAAMRRDHQVSWLD